MIYKIVKCLLIILFFQACSSNRIRSVNEAASHGLKVESLAEDCDFVAKLIKKGMKKAKKNPMEFTGIFYEHNELLQEILKITTCLNGHTRKDLRKQLGKPSTTTYSSKGQRLPKNLIYKFKIVDNKIDIFIFVFENNLLTKIECLPTTLRTRTHYTNGP